MDTLNTLADVPTAKEKKNTQKFIPFARKLLVNRIISLHEKKKNVSTNHSACVPWGLTDSPKLNGDVKVVDISADLFEILSVGEKMSK